MKPPVAVLLVLALCAACGSPTAPDPVTAQACANPAPILGADTRAHPDRVVDEYLVVIRDGWNVKDEAARLAAKHGFTVKETFWITPTFAADLHAEVAAKLRCEPSVSALQFSLTNIPPP